MYTIIHRIKHHVKELFGNVKKSAKEEASAAGHRVEKETKEIQQKADKKVHRSKKKARSLIKKAKKK